MPISATGTSPIDVVVSRAAAGNFVRRRASRSAGFTLIELLVVIFIIGIMTAVVTLSMNFTGRDTELETESKRLLSLMDYAREQAELQTRDYGIYFGEHGYAFVVYDVRTGTWRQVYEDDALRERTLPSGLEFKLVVDARPIVLSDTMDVPSGSSSSQSHASPGAQKSSASASGSGSGSDSDSDSGSDSDSDSASDSDADSDSDTAKSFAPQVMIFSSGDLSSFSITLDRPTAGRSITLDENRDGKVVARKMVEGGGT